MVCSTLIQLNHRAQTRIGQPSPPHLTILHLFMSGYAEQIAEQHSGMLKSCAFLEKPFLPEELANQISRLLAIKAVA